MSRFQDCGAVKKDTKCSKYNDAALVIYRGFWFFNAITKKDGDLRYYHTLAGQNVTKILIVDDYSAIKTLHVAPFTSNCSSSMYSTSRFAKKNKFTFWLNLHITQNRLRTVWLYENIQDVIKKPLKINRRYQNISYKKYNHWRESTGLWFTNKVVVIIFTQKSLLYCIYCTKRRWKQVRVRCRQTQKGDAQTLLQEWNNSGSYCVVLCLV